MSSPLTSVGLQRICRIITNQPRFRGKFDVMKVGNHGKSASTILSVDSRTWCKMLRKHKLQRPWDLLFPPERLYAKNSGFDVGSDLRHYIIMQGRTLAAAFVLAVRGEDCCLVDVRGCDDANPNWTDVLIEHWKTVGSELNSKSLVGPVGAFAFLTDGVSELGGRQPKTIHLSHYPEILVASLRRHGYVHAWSGTIWGRNGAVGTAPTAIPSKHSSVRVGSWMNVISIARDLESVLSTAFSTLPWHRGSGAGLPSLIRAYAPVFSPKLALTASTPDDTVAGAVLMYKDVAAIPNVVAALPRLLQALWLRIAAARSRSIHVSVIGVTPEYRNSCYSADLFAATQKVFDAAENVSTSWIRDDNKMSQMIAKRAGLSPLQKRIVFRLILQSCSTSKGE